ncbi:12777_t:CDS:1 [Gigaspora margarita]|uniref:12777_t:CDS:1 n=1 Tax=Gigaspora margarita TaxID=4874 RepID=A0ABN7VPS1_GIGMA|nr:12777_t:CDS:1 [Gigaspora margarita]
MASQNSQKFSSEVYRLVKSGLSLSPREFEVNELAQNINDVTSIITVKYIYELVIKLKVRKFGSFDDSVVERIGELLWFTVSESERDKILEEYKNLTNNVIEVLTPAPLSTFPTSNVTNEESLDEIIYKGITDFIPLTDSNNQPPDSMNMIGGITPQ